MESHPFNVDDIYLAALERPNAEERIAWLETACAGNPELRRRVERLLEVQRNLGSFLESPAAEICPTSAQPVLERTGSQIGPYKLLQQIGEGGMGVVFMAEQLEPVKRRVALKIIKPGMDTQQVIARFEAERQALALMDHPNIAKVLDAGTTESGRPYFVMELVKGQPITQYCDEKQLTPRQRLELLLPICQAIQHAHQKGIIHRDIKPTNLLVAEYDQRPVPKVIDFGVAKATSQALTERTMFTGFGQIVGTLEYMSPEQAKLNQLDIDTRSDIYSLGVLLYELLTGTTPFDRHRLRAAALDEMLRIIREEEPPKPSTRLSESGDALASISAQRQMEPAKLSKLVRGELDWIVMKSLEKDRNRRYESASSFAMDVQRYLADEPVLACPPSTAYRLRKLVRRHLTVVLAALTILFVLLAGIAGTTFGFVRAELRRIEADKARADEAAQRKIADAEKKKAEQAEEDTLADYRASTDDAIEQLIGSKPDLGPQERVYLENTLKRWQAFAARRGDDERSQNIRAEGHQRVAYVWYKLGRLDESRVEFETALALREKLAANFPNVSEYQLQLANIHGSLATLLRELGQRDAARVKYETARDLLQKLVAAFPNAPENARVLAHIHSNLGVLLSEQGQSGLARTEYETARDLQMQLVATFPAVPRYRQELTVTRTHLGELLYYLGKRDAALTEFKTVREMREKLAADFPAVPQYQQDLAQTHHNLAVLLNRGGERSEALTEFEMARDLQKRLVAAFPAVPWYQQDLAQTQHNFGVLLDELGQRDAARTEFEAARDLRKRLTAVFPTVPHYQRDLALTHNALGLLLVSLNEPDAAQTEYKTALNLQQKLAAAFPAVPGYLEDLAGIHNNIGNLLNGLGQHAAARAEFETARDLHQQLATAFPAVRSFQVNLGGSYCNFGILVRDEGHPADSLRWFDLAIKTLTAVYEDDRSAVTAKTFLRNSHVNRARAYDRLKLHAEAVKDWDTTVELSPALEQLNYRPGRALSRLQAGYTADAVAEVDELTKLPNWLADRWYDFACVYAVASSKDAGNQQQYADRAMQLLRQAVQAGFNNAEHMQRDSDLDLLRRREDFQKLLTELQAEMK